MPAPEELHADLSRRLRAAQAEQRLPSVSAAVFREGEIVWAEALGLADVDAGRAATPDTQYRIGSITKTFTAVAVMQLRDAGRVELDAPLREYIPEVQPGPTVRHALSHLTGLQREPAGEIWETMQMPSREDLLAGLEDVEQVLVPGERWHYSNLAFSLLGELVARRSGTPYWTYVQERVLEPLGLSRTTFAESEPAARGYFVEPYSDGVRPEAHVEIPEPPAAMGQLWSTTGDLARWGAFLAAGDPAVLAKETLDEMSLVQAMVDQKGWLSGWGLGLQLVRRGERVYAGHGGAMPGFLAFVGVVRDDGVGAVALMNTSAGGAPDALALDLAETAVKALPAEPDPWRPDAGAPAEVEPLLGRWWSEGDEVVFRWRQGRLEVQLVGAPAGRDTSYLEPEGADGWRIVEGRERGELVRAVRDASGGVEKLYLATYPLTREPVTFCP